MCGCENFPSLEKLLKVSPWKEVFKRQKELLNVWCSFIVNLIITNISVRDWGFKDVFCQRKYIKDKKKRRNTGKFCFDEDTFMLVTDASFRLVFSLPSLMFSKILWSYGISQIFLGRRVALRATTSHGKCMMRMLLSFRKLSLTTHVSS